MTPLALVGLAALELTGVGLVGVALAGDPAEALAGHKEQAAFFARRGWWQDAELEVSAALALPGGAEDAELLWLGARVAYENVDVALAVARAESAAGRAADQDTRDIIDAYALGLRERYGFVVVDTPQKGVVSRLQLEPQTALLDPEDQRFAARAALFWRDRTPLPATLALPVGLWLVNGEAVQVEADKTNTLVLPLRLTGTGALSALQVTRLETALGVGGWLGARATNLGPAARAQLSLTQPLGPLLLGFGGELTLQPWYTVDSQSLILPPGLGLGGRVGGEVFLGGPLALRPSLSLRWVQIPGLELACDQAEARWICDWEGPASGPAHHVYVAGRGLAPGLDLLVEYREAGRTTALGTGVKLGVEYATGRVPTEGTAILDGEAQPWESAGMRWAMIGVGMQANVAVAF